METNYSVIRQTIVSTYYDNGFTFFDYYDGNPPIDFLCSVYIGYGVTKEQTYRNENTPTLIIARERVSVIINEASGQWVVRPGIIHYQDLETDIINLLSCIQYAFLRAEVNQ